MNQKTTFGTIAGIVFLIVAIVHLLRIFYGWDVTVSTFIVPIWASYVAVVVAGLLSYFGLRRTS